ncbi:MAG: glycosyltransferase, partial [Gemmatimonadota bacterium]
ADPRVHLLGFVSALRSLYKASALLVLPSHREGFGNVLLEAAAMALPVIASDIDGCRDAVAHGITGTLVPLGDVEALVAAADSYLCDPARAVAHGEAGRRRALAEFDPERVWRGIAMVYERGLN